MKILAVDPGLAACGVAYHDTEKGTWKVKTVRTNTAHGNVVERSARIANEIFGVPGMKPEPCDAFCVERMKVYKSQKGDPQDLLDLSFLAGYLAARAHTRTKLYPLPSQWKGQIDKKIHHEQMKRQLPDLAKGRHSKDAWDAIGLVLWTKKKMEFKEYAKSL